MDNHILKQINKKVRKFVIKKNIDEKSGIILLIRNFIKSIPKWIKKQSEKVQILSFIKNIIIKQSKKGRIISFIKNFIKKIIKLGEKSQEEPKQEEEIPEINPYLPKLRSILEQILESYGMNYQIFSPLLLDTDKPPESMLDVDDIELVLEQISDDLNFLKIVTNRPEYFRTYIERMYEDTGLVVQIEEKEKVSLEGVNVILDMERKGNCYKKYMKEYIIYLPFYKRPWTTVRVSQNLDISIPIGYNTVIVKGR